MTSTSLAVLGGERAFPDGLPLVRPTLGDVPALIERLGDVLGSGILTNNRLVRELEERAAEHLDVPHVVAVASCTHGLLLTYQQLFGGLSRGGPVVMPSFTFSASAHAVRWAGGRPVWADVRESDGTLDPASAAVRLEELGDRAAGLSATHLYGTPAQVEELERLAARHGVPLVYDAAHAFGSRRRGTPVGANGSAEVFSLSPTKVLVAGEGGLVATRDDALAQALRHGRDYGNPGDYDTRFVGLNARMSELHAAVALSGLGGLEERLTRRRELVDLFETAVAGVPGIRVVRPEDGDASTFKDLTVALGPAYGLHPVQLQAALKAEGVDSRRYYAPPIHRQQSYAGVDEGAALPVTDRLVEQVLSPPLWSHSTPEQVRGVAELVVAAHERAADVASALRAPAGTVD